MYRIQGMVKGGKTDEEIVQYFVNKYPSGEVLRFIPGARPPEPKAAAPAPKKKAASKKKAAKRAVPPVGPTESFLKEPATK